MGRVMVLALYFSGDKRRGGDLEVALSVPPEQSS
jgi:hypothetical protein